MNRYVAEVSTSHASTCRDQDRVLIETEASKEAVEKVLREVSGDLYDGEEDVDFDANPNWDGTTINEKTMEIKIKLAAAGIDAQVNAAECVFLGS